MLLNLVLLCILLCILTSNCGAKPFLIASRRLLPGEARTEVLISENPGLGFCLHDLASERGLYRARVYRWCFGRGWPKGWVYGDGLAALDSERWKGAGKRSKDERV